MSADADDHSPPLAEQTWFIDWLATKGYAKTSPTTFSNGHASLNVEGGKLEATPASGEHAWTSELAGADPATVKTIVDSILKMRPFLTDADIAKEQTEKQRTERALTGIATTIKDSPDTHSGVQLRRFLWSLYNGHHLVNLWRMASTLDAKRAGWVSEVFTSAMTGGLQEDDIKRALLVAGEMQRWDDVKPSSDHKQDIEEAERHVENVLRSIPPSRSHTEMNTARETLWRVQESLRRAKDPEERER